MGKIMLHGALEFPGGSLDEIDSRRSVGMEIDKAGRQRKPIQVQSPAAASSRFLRRLGTDGDDPAAADENPGAAEVLAAAEHAGAAKKQCFFSR